MQPESAQSDGVTTLSQPLRQIAETTFGNVLPADVDDLVESEIFTSPVADQHLRIRQRRQSTQYGEVTRVPDVVRRHRCSHHLTQLLALSSGSDQHDRNLATPAAQWEI
ncbi:hypothetical protein AS594_39965 [Streptomyces agglomeratus]|uniref:Uncharacterized protein n=1 Tax=Streptomyces agglomeratus TaxID=285458 RepID=A0A1E5NZD8_9ACTN|nr:hypothetical protein AS594_39965 [Streptomyces agglomeratus]